MVPVSWYTLCYPFTNYSRVTHALAHRHINIGKHDTNTTTQQHAQICLRRYFRIPCSLSASDDFLHLYVNKYTRVVLIFFSCDELPSFCHCSLFFRAVCLTFKCPGCTWKESLAWRRCADFGFVCVHCVHFGEPVSLFKPSIQTHMDARTNTDKRTSMMRARFIHSSIHPNACMYPFKHTNICLHGGGKTSGKTCCLFREYLC